VRAQLGVTLAVVHFNHRIRPEAAADEAFVAGLAKAHQVEFLHGSGNTPAHARDQRLSLEAAARQLRYDYFQQLLHEGHVTRIATAHTRDDQAETVLLRILRGAGMRGVAGIYPSVQVEPEVGAEAGRSGYVIRPLLHTPRQELRAYLNSLGQSWREDASNLDLKHSRNRVRHSLMPLLEREYNPALRRVLAEMAEVAREEELYLSKQGAEVLAGVLGPLPSPDQAPGVSAPLLSLDATLLRKQPLPMQRRVLRAAAERLGTQLDFHHVQQALGLLDDSTGAGGEMRHVELPGGLAVAARRGQMWFEPSRMVPESRDYDCSLPVPGEVQIPQLGFAIRASMAISTAYNQEHLLDPATLGSLRVRNWRAGDRYHPVHSKSPRKLKALLQERHLSQPLKGMWPVVVSGEQIVWVPGWGVSAEFCLRATGPGVLLEHGEWVPGEIFPES
ncbi:MAG: tRNA lysidine(34) synthetase TilS, partial [Candidatus Korobacteraceae bacterium]